MSSKIKKEVVKNGIIHKLDFEEKVATLFTFIFSFALGAVFNHSFNNYTASETKLTLAEELKHEAYIVRSNALESFLEDTLDSIKGNTKLGMQYSRKHVPMILENENELMDIYHNELVDMGFKVVRESRSIVLISWE